jgi:hypothetical protein
MWNTRNSSVSFANKVVDIMQQSAFPGRLSRRLGHCAFCIAPGRLSE